MVNTITTQTIVDGTRNLVVKVDILGDGSGEETGTVIIDASSFSTTSTDMSLCGFWSALNGFTARLEWDATANTPLLSVVDYDMEISCSDTKFYGGIPNNAGAGKTGDIVLNTTGLGNGDNGTMIFSLRKH